MVNPGAALDAPVLQTQSARALLGTALRSEASVCVTPWSRHDGKIPSSLRVLVRSHDEQRSDPPTRAHAWYQRLRRALSSAAGEPRGVV